MTLTFLKNMRAEKSDRLALRISAKNKFALELLAQKEGLSLSTLFMQILEKPLKEGLTISKQNGRQTRQIFIPDEAYDPLIPDRLVKLAMIAPELLNDREKVIWKVIQEKSAYYSDGSPNFKVIRDGWESIQIDAEELLKKHSNLEKE